MEILKDEIWVASMEYTWDNLTLTAEYSENEEVKATPMGDQSMTSAGWYTQASWRFNDWCAANIYYSEYYGDKDDKDGNTFVEHGEPDYHAWQKEIVPSLRFDVGYNFIVKAEVHFVNGVAQVYDFNNPDGREEDWNLYVLKASYNF